MTTPLTILAIFAHPDDEIGVGSTLAYYGEAGVRTVLVCATRGEVATIFCDDCATRENLAEVRTRELECACGHLGIGELRWLDWPDGGVNTLPRAEAVDAIVRQVREVRPDVILTHPKDGLYPHPDHLAVWEIVREAYSAAADSAEYPDAGPAWAPARLFTRAISQSYFEAAPGLKEFRVELNGQLLPFYGTPDNEIDVTMRVEAYVERRLAAWDCHRSQHNPKGFSSTMPDGMRREMAANEQYVLADARVPLPEGVGDDLLAGLVAADDHAGAESVDADYAAESLAALRVELIAHRSLVDVCLGYQSRSNEPNLTSFVQHLADGEQEIVYLLARALRRAGEPSGTLEADPKLRARALRYESTPDRVRYLRTLTEQIVARCQAQLRRADDPDQKAVWEELTTLVQAQARSVAEFAG
jgi:N-acetyl-1-D-myo-inositol-2-amino-2-deoxy-alpha-D-glucopyranoside deacetylase